MKSAWADGPDIISPHPVRILFCQFQQNKTKPAPAFRQGPVQWPTTQHKMKMKQNPQSLPFDARGVKAAVVIKPRGCGPVGLTGAGGYAFAFI